MCEGNSGLRSHIKRESNLFWRKPSKRIQIHFISSVARWNCLHYTQGNTVCKWHFHSQIKLQSNRKKMGKRRKVTKLQKKEQPLHNTQKMRERRKKTKLQKGRPLQKENLEKWRNEAQLRWMLAPWAWWDFHISKGNLRILFLTFSSLLSVGRI